MKSSNLAGNRFSTTPNKSTLDFIGIVKKKIISTSGVHYKRFYDPLENLNPLKCPLEDFYKKGVVVLDFDHKFPCGKCKTDYSSQGWCGEFRHIHGLKSSSYLLQKQ